MVLLTNHLINEQSPYLLQHAHNPVNWYPWGEEAFAKAKREHKLVFLSIGYSTCHWCHVMEKESFEDTQVAKILNDHYVAIKVDREERPDIDQIYMSFCQKTTGRGGWPLTVFLTPEQQPFYAGSYYPKRSRNGQVGLMDLLPNAVRKWETDEAAVRTSSQQMTNMLNSESQPATDAQGIGIGNENGNGKPVLNPYVIPEAYQYFKKSFDPVYGGFGGAPKFPTPHNMLFLLRYHVAYKEPHALYMVEKTLEQMYFGGLFDHVGFGFSRYSTDAKWLVPHFEKMLYDNALLLMAYTEAYQLTQKELYKSVAQKIITYVSENLLAPEGGFYCAQDADSEGVEGKYYVWSKAEILEILGDTVGSAFCDVYQVSEKGNFEGKNILNLIETEVDKQHETSGNLGIEVKSDERIQASKNFNVEAVLKILKNHRDQRIPPHLDDKILTSWNGLMIAALAKAGNVFQMPQYIELAIKASTMIEEKLTRADGRLLARYRQGDVKHLAYLEDYAFMTWAYMELYEGTFQVKYLEKACQKAMDILTLFEDTTQGGLYLYGKDGEQLIARPKELYDGALPSGNSTAAMVFMKLSRLTGEAFYEEKAKGLFEFFTESLNQAPMAYTMMLSAYLFSKQPTKEIVLAGSLSDPVMQEMLAQTRSRFLPFATILVNEDAEQLKKVNGFASTQQKIAGQTTAYVCESFTCQRPVLSVGELVELL